MKEYPILFSAKMVAAILEGRKTQTRRVIKPQPQKGKNDARSRYGSAGDVLWVRETWQAQERRGRWWHEIRSQRELYNWAWTNPVYPAYEAVPPRWLPGIHMPREACRITLDIVDVRVERVQDITWRDCMAEGAPYHYSDTFVEDHAVMWFGELWNRINAPRGFGWETNPWVWVIEFKAA